MNKITLLLFISLLIIIHGSYNPIPIGSVIISTKSQILVMKPVEYDGNDDLKPIFTALPGMIIIDTVYDPTTRDLYLLFVNASESTAAPTGTSTSTSASILMNSTSLPLDSNLTATVSTNTTGRDITSNSSSTPDATGNIYVCRLASLEQLDSTIYRLPITFNTANINQLNSFTSDIVNSRVFLTDQTGTIRLFSMSGLLLTTIVPPPYIANKTRSVAYSNSLNTLFIITDQSVYSCSNLDTAALSCCEASLHPTQLRSISFDETSGDTSAYVLDAKTGIYQVGLNADGCAASLTLINQLGTYVNLHFAIDRGLYFASASSIADNDNTYLVIANGTKLPRPIPVNSTIVALHISIPAAPTTSPDEETCFQGITYNDYRAAVILAALFGTIMGIFMCFNVLFCIDFIMTKRIIKELKLQIPHNLLEDRWNKLVEEKYAKIALEQQRKKDDPPAPLRRQSSAAARKLATTASSSSGDSRQASTVETLQVPNPIPKITGFLRRQSENYFSRRRSEDPRAQRQAQFTEIEPNRPTTASPAQLHFEPVTEENENRAGLRQNLSRRQLLQGDDDFL